ncbi:coronatine-insensitive protein 1-like protein [Tanacetum coccineum]
MTRKHITIHNSYSVPLSRLVKRFPYLESLKLKGYPPRALMFSLASFEWGGYATPWVQEIVKNLQWLECVKFKRMIVRDSDLEVLAERCGEKLKVLKIEACMGFSTDGLLHFGRKCCNLRIFCLETSFFDENGSEWLHELALRNKCIESLNFYLTPLGNYDYKDLVLIAKNCSESLVSLKIRGCPRKYVVEIFSYAVKLEDFGGDPYIDEGEGHIGLKFPPKTRRITWNHGNTLDIPILERDFGLQVAGHYCKKLRRIKIESGGQEGLVSHLALTALAKGCLELEYLHINVKDITNETLECIGANLKYLRNFFLRLLHKVEEVSELPLDSGVRALLTGCTKLVKLGIHLRSGTRGLTDVGWGYLGKYGLNLIYMNLGFCRDSDAGLLELSKWCLKLQKLEIRGCAFSQQALATFVLNVTSLRYLWVHDYQAFKNGHDIFAMVRPFWKMELIKYKSNVAAQQQPPSLLAYYSVAEQRKDIPDSVIPLYPYVKFD